MSAVPGASSSAFALLDDASTSSRDGARTSRLYTGWQCTLTLQTGEPHERLFAELEEALSKGSHVVGLFSYELGLSLQQLTPDLPLNSSLAASLSRVLVFERCESMSADDVGRWLDQRARGAAQAVTEISPALSESEFAEAVDSIHHYIEAGDTYQVNFTFPMRFTMHGDPVALYAALRARQPVPYGALVMLPEGSAVLSLSPELFVSHRDGKFICKPMKGTAPASQDDALDTERARLLRQSPKERSENLMIVDLMRNDLGRIAITGSVSVPELFAVERFGAVLQMTSTIAAAARPALRLQQVFEALYPCGSITGAPKRRTMQLLQQLERWPRGLYTGAIGWFDPPAKEASLGDFTLSVPIRTLLLDPPDANDRRRGEMGVGAGIVYDSDAKAEYQECLLKSRFVTGIEPGFELFETMHATHGGCRYLHKHLARLFASCERLSFRFDESSVRHGIAAACSELDDKQEYRLRISLDASGKISISTAAVKPQPDRVRVLLSATTMPSDDALLAHKTTLRRTYDQGWQQAEAQGAFDMLFFNERGELTEGGRCNVFVQIDGEWATPPLSSGLLPGVMRGILLEDPAWNARERPISRDELLNAQSVVVCNALRGVMRAEIVPSQ